MRPELPQRLNPADTAVYKASPAKGHTIEDISSVHHSWRVQFLNYPVQVESRELWPFGKDNKCIRIRAAFVGIKCNLNAIKNWG